MKKICFLSAIIALPLLYSCDKQEDRDRLTFVQWSGRPKHKNINDIIPINIQAKGDTMTFHGDNSAIFMEQSPYNGSILLSSTISGSTPIHATVIRHIAKASRQSYIGIKQVKHVRLNLWQSPTSRLQKLVLT